MEGEVAVEARQAGDHHPSGAGAAGEGEEQQEAEETAGAEAVADRAEESRLGEDEEAWPRPCRRRHLEDVLVPVAVAQVEQTKRMDGWTEKTSLVEEREAVLLCSCGWFKTGREVGGQPKSVLQLLYRFARSILINAIRSSHYIFSRLRNKLVYYVLIFNFFYLFCII